MVTIAERTKPTRSIRSGISVGSALAIAISWDQHHSILWATLHGICSWFYVLYFGLTR